MSAQQQSTAKATTPRELDRVERAFAEAGLLGDEFSRLQAHEEAVAGLAPLEEADLGADHVARLFARALLGRAPSETAVDAGRIARLVDRLAADLDTTRARVARALLVARDGEDSPSQGFAAGAPLALLA